MRLECAVFRYRDLRNGFRPAEIHVRRMSGLFYDRHPVDFLAMPKGGGLLSTRPLSIGSARQRCIGHLWRGDGVLIHSPLLTAAEYVALVIATT